MIMNERSGTNSGKRLLSDTEMAFYSTFMLDSYTAISKTHDQGVISMNWIRYRCETFERCYYPERDVKPKRRFRFFAPLVVARVPSPLAVSQIEEAQNRKYSTLTM